MRPNLHRASDFKSLLFGAISAPASGVRPPLRPAFRPVHTERILCAVSRAWGWIAAKRQAQLSSRHLRVLETVQLGEKRFVAVLDVEGARFLIGGAAGQVTLLTELKGGPPDEPSGATEREKA